MSNDVEAEGTSVALGVSNAGAHLKITELVVTVGRAAGRQPNLRGGMAVAEDDGRQAGNGVVGVGDAERGARLARGVVGKDIVTDTGRAKGVNIDLVAIAAEVSTTKNGNGAAQRVTGNHDSVAGVALQTLFDSRVSAILDLVPGCSKASVDFAARGEVTVLPREDDIGNEVADVVATTDRNNNLTADIVNGSIGCNASSGTPKYRC